MKDFTVKAKASLRRGERLETFTVTLHKTGRSSMTPRTKKLIGLVILLPAMLLYFITIIIIADFIPANKFLQILFFATTGIIWVFPLKPLFMWINKE